MTPRVFAAAAAGALGLVLALLSPAGAGSPERAVSSGPRLETPTARLDRAVRCPTRTAARAAERTVLLVHGTGSTPHESWSWGYVRALRADGFAVCTVRLPDRGLGDFTVAAEYVVHAVRVAHRRSGSRIGVIGHSQGGALGVWVTTFWPDVARAVGDVISIAGPMRGTALADGLCAAGRCTTLAWQNRTSSHTLAAMRRAGQPARTAYTSIGTRYDEVVFPQPTASRLRGARNITVQDVCAADPVEHGLILGDPVSYALAVDALTHSGPADPRRAPASLCTETFIPHGDPFGSGVFLTSLANFGFGVVDPRRYVDAEPRLPAYAR